MTRDHRRCDGLFAAVEEAANRGEWSRAANIFQDFVQGMERHLRIEEELLFPAFEHRSGITGGPTELMRLEHAQMRGLLGEMRQALERCDLDDYLGVSETALIMMQQHNLKEEQVLYSMMDGMLGEQIPELLEQAERLGV
jgi:hemerythrin-like domain-containing protein